MQFKKHLFFFVSFGVLVLGVAVVSAVTTISTNVVTEGNLSVTGTAGVDGNTTLSGDLYVGGLATTTAASGNITTAGTLGVTGATTLSDDLYVGTKATTTAASGNIATQGSVTIGSGGTAIATILCAATTTDWPALAGSACAVGTSTLTGVTASIDDLGWAFFVSPVATTSGVENQPYPINISAIATSTDVIQLKVCNSTSTSVNLPVQYYEVCAMKH
ncbi:MAG: hypothetical protein PHN39_03335 [Candidatus Pacebacteria bacterium]|nr:hypothetical protein [Candidatus Paceibacterota bacterium]